MFLNTQILKIVVFVTSPVLKILSNMDISMRLLSHKNCSSCNNFYLFKKQDLEGFCRPSILPKLDISVVEMIHYPVHLLATR